jgi:endonuclease/exonuclease/phosphatase (EEP) superfamily protein YafD
VMTINANQGEADAARIADLARQYGASVVIVTELTSRLAHDLTGAGLNAAVTPRVVDVSEGGTRGIGVYTRDELTDTRTLDDLSRPAASGVLQTEAGPVGLLVTHAAGSALLPGRDWHEDLARLPKLAPDVERRIMIGDFNATPWNPAFRRLASGEWHDAADVVGRGLRPTWPAFTPLPISPLDHVLVAGEVGVNAVETATVAGSDHRALIVTVVLRR